MEKNAFIITKGIRFISYNNSHNFLFENFSHTHKAYILINIVDNFISMLIFSL